MTEIWRRSWYLHASCSTGFRPLTAVARSNWKTAWGRDGGPFGTPHCVASRLLACSRSHLGCGYTVTLPSARRSDQPLLWPLLRARHTKGGEQRQGESHD